MMKALRILSVVLLTMAAWSTIASAGTWTKLTNQPTFNTDTALLLTDGTVMMHQYNSGNWWRLTADNTGSFANGTWTQLATMPSGYAPLYFASLVLIDGRVLIEGGEYNNLVQNETNKGAIYDPTTNTWTSVTAPSGWSTIGDSPAISLADGTVMMGQGGQPAKLQVTFNASTLTWTSVGTGKADGFSEEGFAALPNGDVMVVDCENGTNSEVYNPSTAAWTSAGSTIVSLPNSGNLGIVPEMGPLMQRPDGTVVAFGATVHNSIYNSTTGVWAQGPDYPNKDDEADGNASILPNGNILVYTSPGVFSGTGTFYEFTYGTDTFVTEPSTSKGTKLESWDARQLLLPNGQVLWVGADGSTIDAEVYTSTGGAQAAWKPTIASVPTTLTPGSSYSITGTQFNGFSAGTAYGDDATMATNYPLIRITNGKTRHVFYARTHNHSTMGIATGNAVVSTTFDVPSTLETGLSQLVVVANGIASAPKRVTIK